MMTVEEKPDVTYSDLGGCKDQIDKIREVVEKMSQTASAPQPTVSYVLDQEKLVEMITQKLSQSSLSRKIHNHLINSIIPYK